MVIIFNTMKKQFSILLIIFLSSNSYGQCFNEKFWPYYPSSNLEGLKTLLLKDGGYLLYGTCYRDTFDWGRVPSDLVLIKIDSCGHTQWINADGYEGDGDNQMQAIETDSGDILIAGYTSAGLQGSMGNTRVGKYTKNGQLVKARLYEGSPISATDGMVKLKYRPNRFVVFGYTYNIPSGKTYAQLLEINSNLDLVHKKIFSPSEFNDPQANEGGVGNFLEKSPDSNFAIFGIGSSGYFVWLDSTFAIQKITKMGQDSMDFLPPGGFYTNRVLWSKDSLSLEGAGRVTYFGNSSYTAAFLRMNLEGKVTYVKDLPDTIPYTTCISRTNDGGYIAGPYLQKLDSNFNTQWIKKTNGELNSVYQLKDGRYIGSGLSFARTTQSNIEYLDEVYFVRTDSEGVVNRTGIKERKAQTPTISIYPNPSTTGIYTLTGYQGKDATLFIFNQQGQQILKQSFSNTSFDLQNQPEGMYYIRLMDANGKLVHQQSVLKTK